MWIASFWVWLEEKKEHGIILFLGKIEGESNDAAHLIICVSVTSSVNNVSCVLERSIKVKTSIDLKMSPIYQERQINYSSQVRYIRC